LGAKRREGERRFDDDHRTSLLLMRATVNRAEEAETLSAGLIGP
jgi:hypothetical protein